MNILGVSDGPFSAAALTVDGHLVALAHQERLQRERGTRAFPWLAIDRVLAQAGLAPTDIDVVGLAGRFSPPLVARRHPSLRRLGRDPFSPLHDWRVLYSAVMRHSGLGALEADLASDWLLDHLGERGLRPHRAVLVDTHRALAEAAYRQQDDTTDVLVLTVHPRGDGVAIAAHVGNSAQLDRFWVQKGFASLHVHLARCAASIGLQPDVDDAILWGLASNGEAKEGLAAMLSDHVRADGLKLSRRSYLVPSTRGERVYRALGEASLPDAAASIYANLRRTILQLVRTHVQRWGIGTVALGGAVFDNPRLVAAVAELDEVERVLTGPEPGWGALAVGAATMLAGRPPRPVRWMGYDLGSVSSRELKAASRVLAKGGAVALAAGVAGPGPEAGGSRAALVRADDPSAVERLRTRLGRPEYESPLGLVSPHRAGEVASYEKMDLPLRYGTAAPLVPASLAADLAGVTSRDARARLQVAEGLVEELLDLSGVPALAAFPLGLGTEPCADNEQQARAVAATSDLHALIAKASA